jgi:hypothetical protein
LAWQLIIGLVAKQFNFGDEFGGSIITRNSHPFRYWIWAFVLASLILIFALLFYAWLKHPQGGSG